MQITTITTKRAAEAIAGTLGKPSKMPGRSYGISATQCKTGGRLQKIKGSVCEGCYALKANYLYASVETAHIKRMAGLTHPAWADAMIFLIKHSGEEYFRWHDSGDLQSFQHLLNIVRVAEALPSVNFWLPTKEKKLIHQYRAAFGDFPANLCVRLSGAMVNAEPPAYEGNTSTVHTHDAKPHGVECKAYLNQNKCGDCRACWSKEVKNVSYRQH